MTNRCRSTFMLMLASCWLAVPPWLSAPLGRLSAPTAVAARQDAPPDVAARHGDKLRMRDAIERTTGRAVRVGTCTVWEDRARAQGRTIDLDIVIISARSEHPKADPVFFLAGGPGQGAAELFRRYMDHWITRERDLVFVSQRGTGKSNGMYFASYGAGDGQAGLQRFLGPLFDAASISRARKEFEQRADLTKYTTPIAMDDLNEVRQALGYEQINLMGGSYGTRAAMIYMRRHPETVRCSILSGIAPVQFINPLYHAREAQHAIERIFELCAADPDCNAAYPNIVDEFLAVLDRLDEEPAVVSVTDPQTGDPTQVQLTRDAFAAAVRFMMYYDHSQIPLLIRHAFEGEFTEFAERAIANAMGVEQGLALGMLLCVTCSEDVPRIDPEIIDDLTDDTFLGDTRIRSQMAACDLWPRGEVPQDYGDAVRADVPTLLFSGTLDPVTGPEFGRVAAAGLPNCVHVIAPGSHGVAGPCIDEIMQAFLEHPVPAELDTSCVEQMRLRRFVLPAK